MSGAAEKSNMHSKLHASNAETREAVDTDRGNDKQTTKWRCWGELMRGDRSLRMKQRTKSVLVANFEIDDQLINSKIVNS